MIHNIRPSLFRQARLLLLGAFLILPFAAHSREATVAVADFDLLDTSLQGEMMPSSSKADQKRLERTMRQIARQLDDSKFFTVVGTKAAARISGQLRENQVYLHDCNGCEMRIGETVNADYVLVGWVQKVSNLILNMNLALRKVPAGEDVVGVSVDMRGNTDEAWSRAATYVLENSFFPGYAKVQEKNSDQ
ncbi:MAG: DUF3280 domain-containing protein [Gammaproteobacteria bacterium]|nr:DUF3280 domain-containing protein [Gammaproteobacteria bacterium]